jgi:periplasmic mercuric ion binding protein
MNITFQYTYFEYKNNHLKSKKMKAKLIMMVTLIFLASGIAQLYAQEFKTEKIKVYGKCGECKVRIEDAANSVTGVTKANWNIDTKMLEVTFNTSKTSNETIQKAIAKVGHDTEKYKADDNTYDALPACCHYDRKLK